MQFSQMLSTRDVLFASPALVGTIVGPWMIIIRTFLLAWMLMARARPSHCKQRIPLLITDHHEASQSIEGPNRIDFVRHDAKPSSHATATRSTPCSCTDAQHFNFSSSFRASHQPFHVAVPLDRFTTTAQGPIKTIQKFIAPASTYT